MPPDVDHRSWVIGHDRETGSSTCAASRSRSGGPYAGDSGAAGATGRNKHAPLSPTPLWTRSTKVRGGLTSTLDEPRSNQILIAAQAKAQRSVSRTLHPSRRCRRGVDRCVGPCRCPGRRLDRRRPGDPRGGGRMPGLGGWTPSSVK